MNVLPFRTTSHSLRSHIPCQATFDSTCTPPSLPLFWFLWMAFGFYDWGPLILPATLVVCVFLRHALSFVMHWSSPYGIRRLVINQVVLDWENCQNLSLSSSNRSPTMQKWVPTNTTFLMRRAFLFFPWVLIYRKAFHFWSHKTKWLFFVLKNERSTILPYQRVFFWIWKNFVIQNRSKHFLLAPLCSIFWVDKTGLVLKG